MNYTLVLGFPESAVVFFLDALLHTVLLTLVFGRTLCPVLCSYFL